MVSMIELLKKIPGFSRLDDELLSVIDEVMDPVTVRRGETLCTEGEKGDKMFIICQNCGYKWETKSELLYVTCPSCARKTEKREV